MTACYSIHQGDCIEWLRHLPDESVDLIITDPAYESLEKHRKRGTTTRLKKSKSSSNKWFDVFPNRRFQELFAELYRVLKRDRHFYMFCDAETMFVAKPLAEAAGFRWWNNIIWVKDRIGMGYHYRRKHEYILFLEKGKRRLRDLGIADVIECKTVRGEFPTQKPLQVASILSYQSSEPGELVVDPFMGSGTVGEAALIGARSFAGCDVSDDAHAATRKRLGAFEVGDPFAEHTGQRGLFQRVG
jgi:site-specific DNA-methyltransferase (adenine-specific)